MRDNMLAHGPPAAVDCAQPMVHTTDGTQAMHNPRLAPTVPIRPSKLDKEVGGGSLRKSGNCT